MGGVQRRGGANSRALECVPERGQWRVTLFAMTSPHARHVKINSKQGLRFTTPRSRAGRSASAWGGWGRGAGGRGGMKTDLLP